MRLPRLKARVAQVACARGRSLVSDKPGLSSVIGFGNGKGAGGDALHTSPTRPRHAVREFGIVFPSLQIAGLQAPPANRPLAWQTCEPIFK